MERIRTIIAAAVALALSSAASVQVATQTAPPEHKACKPGERMQHGDSGLKAPSATTGESLSDVLARTEGVLCPPATDPDIKAPTPDAGKTPVLPPPGSPGGDPSVRPK